MAWSDLRMCLERRRRCMCERQGLDYSVAEKDHRQIKINGNLVITNHLACVSIPTDNAHCSLPFNHQIKSQFLLRLSGTLSLLVR